MQVTRTNPSPAALSALRGYFSRQGELNGVDSQTVSGGQSFAIEPTVQQTLHDTVQHSSAFLTQYVNFELVDDISGQKIFIDDDGLVITSNTDTSGSGKRSGIDPSTLKDKGYECRTNDFDTLLPWSKLNKWAKFPDFQMRLTEFLSKRQALDHIKIGFNGTSYAANSNRTANPLGQDVNIGWLQTIRAEAPAHVKSTDNSFGSAETDYFKNIDAMAFSARKSLLDEVHRERLDLVVILGSSLLNDKYFKVMNKEDIDPSEHTHRDALVSEKRIGGMEAITVPYFPEDAFLIMPKGSLSVYEQEGSRRTKLDEDHASRGYNRWFTHNVDYVVENLGAVALVENIVDSDEPTE
ncbi:MAG: phage major capsid protein, P2 family [Gammaproteobacteria bacterium]|nr:MAG: phage major capsid protein, P2 family [Gammaproteobacteria bacterium]